MKAGLTLCFSVLLLIYHTAYSQDFSNKGRDFWVIYTGHVDGTVSRMALYITSDQNASGVVQVNGANIPFSVTANNVTTVQFTNATTPSNSVVYNGQLEGVGINKGIHITSDKPIVVYAHILNSARSGSTLVLPTSVLGKEYYAASYAPTSLTSADRSEFAVVATVDNTIVEITPSAADANGTHTANVAFQVTLNKGDVYQYQSNYDLTGSHIKSIGNATVSCQPIAVFSGSTRSFIGCTNANSGDNLYQQLFPFASWGRLYYTAPFINRAYDIFRILVQDPSTVVSVNGVPLNPSSLVNGRFYEVNTQGNNTAKIISSDKPICVFQYLISQGCDGVQSDPEMVILNAVDQTLNDITVMSARNDLTPPATNITSHYLNIIIKTNALTSLKIDGNAPSAAAVSIPGTGYSYIQENVTASTSSNPSHHITSDSGFICLAYGYGNIESYGYNAGTNVKDRYQYITMRNLYASVNFPATCIYTPFYFFITLPYQPASLTWDFNNNPDLSPNSPVVNNAPVPDSSFVIDGKTLYVYRLQSIFTYSATGTFPVKVIAQNPTAEGCSGTQEITYDVVVSERPQVDFSITGNGCLSSTMQFADSTNSFGRTVLSYNWTFGDNTTSQLKNPSKQYAQPGNYNVKLKVVTDIGCTNDTSKIVAITSDPVAKFGFTTPVCENKSIAFSDSSTIATGTITEWSWNFGDSTVIVNSNNATVNHSYTVTGAYDVTLKLVTAAGCTDSLRKTINVHPQPIANFIVPDVCLNDAFAQFNDSSFIADGSTLNYLWKFGDSHATPSNPDSSALKDPKHTYSSTGDYNTSLVVTSSYGCNSSVSKTFTVNGSFPVAACNIIDSNNLCSNALIQLENRSQVFPGSITRVEIIWDEISAPTVMEADEYPFPGKIYTHAYPSLPVAKSCQVKFRAYSGQSCASEISKTITVNGAPKVVFPPIADICYNDSAVLLTQVKELSGLNGAGIFQGPGVSPNGLFDPASVLLNGNSGTYQLFYTYTTNKGCKNTDSSSITVWKVTADAGPGLLVLEGNSAMLKPVVSGSSLTYQWSPDTWLNSSTIRNPVTTPVNDITYTLKVTGNAGCTASDTVAIKVLKQPVIPNVFSPNGDGINDTWHINYLDAYPKVSVTVYNRYGAIVYRCYGYYKPWDGTFQGKPVPVGVYYYIVDAGYGRQPVAGWVTVLR